MSVPMSGSKALASLPVLPLALLVSLLFSLLLSVSNSQLNDDAFTYLRAAERFQQDGAAAVLAEYGWHGYSILVALADSLLPGGLDTSAQVINALCYALLTGVFIALQREGGAGARQVMLAAGVVLLFPLLNEMRHFIIRDAAYWALSMLALLQLIRLMKASSLKQGWPLALAWCGSTLLASTFRLEALLPAVIAPLALLAKGRHLDDGKRGNGLHMMLLLYTTLLASAVLLLLLGLAAGVHLPELIGFAWRHYLPLLLDIGKVLRDDALELNSAIFTTGNFPDQNDTGVGLLVLLFAYGSSVLLNLAKALGLPFTLLLLLGLQQRVWVLPRRFAAAWLGYALPALLALLVFQFIMHFQTQRYAALLALLLLLWLPGMLEQWWQHAEQQGKARRFLLTLAFFSVCFAVDSLVSFGYSKRHLEQAEQWLLQELPADAALATNSFQLAWRSGVVENYDKTQRDVALTLQTATQAAAMNTQSNNYLALELKQSDTAARQLLEQSDTLELVTNFSNERGDEVRIYLQNPPAR